MDILFLKVDVRTIREEAVNVATILDPVPYVCCYPGSAHADFGRAGRYQWCPL